MLRKDLKKKADQFRKANTPEEKLRLSDADRRDKNWVMGKPGKTAGLGFLEDWFAKEIAKPQAELAGISEAWTAQAPAELQDARLLAFKHGALEMAVASAAAKYKLEMALRTGLEQRLRAAYKGGTLKKVKVSVGTGGTAQAEAADETEALRREKLAEVRKAAEKGEL